MMKKLFFIIAAVFSLLACDNDESVKSLNFEDSAFGIVGRWYAENNSDDTTFDMFGEYVFTADGAIFIDEYRKINGYRRNELQGTYSVKNNSITTEFDFNEGGQSTSSLKVTEGLTFSASFHRFSEDYPLTLQRIVGEITLMVDSTLNVTTEVLHNIEAYSSKPVEIKSYSMNDSAIASVDDDGLLTAKLIGVTYLKVETSIGTAVLKVSVSDKDNLWNDFSKVLGRDFDDVERMLGKHYVYKNNDSIRYYYDNPYVDSVGVYRIENRADSIIVSFSKNTTGEMIVNYLRSKLDTVKTEKDLDFRWFTDNNNYLLSKFSAKYYHNERVLIYTNFEPDWDDRRNDFGVTSSELIEKFGLPNGLKNTIMSFLIRNDFVKDVSYNFTPNVKNGNVDSYNIYLNSDVTKDMAQKYIDRKYIPCRLYPYYSYTHGKNIIIDGKEYVMFVRYVGGGEHRLSYQFQQYQ